MGTQDPAVHMISIIPVGEAMPAGAPEAASCQVMVISINTHDSMRPGVSKGVCILQRLLFAADVGLATSEMIMDQMPKLQRRQLTWQGYG